MKAQDIFSTRFLAALKDLIDTHHSIYPVVPPQGIFFEYLAEQAFRRSGWPAGEVVLTTPNSPMHDLKVGKLRLSLKTETGKIIDRTRAHAFGPIRPYLDVAGRVGRIRHPLSTR
jgi:hypothetical protein